MKKISVCIATYNGEKYIYDQLASILSQLSANDEIIISDDSSTDKTIEIIKSFNDLRIKISPNQTFKNPIFNFENAIAKSTGDYIFLADQDDVWLPGRVNKAVNVLSSTNSKLVLINGYIVDENLNQTNVTLFDYRKPSVSTFKNIIKNSFTGCSMAFTAEVKKLVLPFPATIPMHDQWLGMIVTIFCKTAFINEPLLYYRRHGGNASFTGEKSQFGLFKKLMFRFAIVNALVKRVYCLGRNHIY